MDFINELYVDLKKENFEAQLDEEVPYLLRRRFNSNSNFGKVQKAPANSHSVKPKLPAPSSLSVIAGQFSEQFSDNQQRELQVLELKKKQQERQKREAELRNRRKASALEHDIPAVAPLLGTENGSIDEKIKHRHSSGSIAQNSDSSIVEVGDYKVKVDYQLGSGGYSNVYAVVDQLTNKRYALKVVDLRGVGLVQVKQNLLEEVKLLRDLTNVDHVVQLVTSKVTDSQVLMLMEQGTSDLNKLMDDSKDKFDIHFVRYWGGQILSAVAAVHKHNIVHSDLKPANFLVVKGALKLCDFGISNKMPTNGTSVIRSLCIGTLQYMAPETRRECPRLAKPSHCSSQSNSDQPSLPSRVKSSYAEKLLKRKSNIFSPDDSDLSEQSPPAETSSVARRSNPNLSIPPGQDLSSHSSSYKVSKASDVWSCGIILFEMVYKFNPVDSQPIESFLDTQLQENQEKFAIEHPKYSCNVLVPRSLHEVIRDCLQFNPRKRITAQAAFKSLFFTPVAIDLEGVLSIVRSGCKYGHNLGLQKRELRSEKMEELAHDLFRRIAKLTNGE